LEAPGKTFNYMRYMKIKNSKMLRVTINFLPKKGKAKLGRGNGVKRQSRDSVGHVADTGDYNSKWVPVRVL